MIATGAAFLLPPQPAMLLVLYFATVIAAAFVTGWDGGATATGFALVALAVMFNENLALAHYAVFAMAGAIVCGITWRLRREGIEFSGERLWRAAAGTSTDDVHIPAPFRVPRMVLRYALPLLVFFIYWNVSDIASRILRIPSLLQPMIVVLAALVWKYRTVFRPSGIVAQPVTLLLVCYTALLFVSTVWAENLSFADDRVVDTVKNLLILLIAGSLAVSWAALRRALMALTIAAAALASVSIVQILTNQTFGQLGGFARVEVGTIYAKSSDMRAAGPVGDPNFYAQILVMAVPLGLYLAYSALRRRERQLWMVVTALVAGGVLVTYSRGAMLALGVMTGIAVLALRVPVTRIAIAGAAAVGLLLIAPGNVSKRLESLQVLLPGGTSGEVDHDSSVEKRKLLLRTAALMFDEHLAFGVGTGNFSSSYPEYANRVGSAAKQYDEPGDRMFAHTLYLEIGAENGLAGLALFLGAMGSALAALWHCRHLQLLRGHEHHAMLLLALALALAGYLMTSLFLHGAFQRYLWMLLAFVTAATRLTTTASNHIGEAAA
ncbi:MAG TPA: O-antigen ligase family protein [Thermoanaerobaculia bacterium]